MTTDAVALATDALAIEQIKDALKDPVARERIIAVVRDAIAKSAERNKARQLPEGFENRRFT